jgi:hypothetical protein
MQVLRISLIKTWLPSIPLVMLNNLWNSFPASICPRFCCELSHCVENVGCIFGQTSTNSQSVRIRRREMFARHCSEQRKNVERFFKENMGREKCWRLVKRALEIDPVVSAPIGQGPNSVTTRYSYDFTSPYLNS